MGISNDVDFSAAAAASHIHPGVGDDRHRAANDGVRKKRRRVVHQLPAHPGDWREGAEVEGVRIGV